MQPKNVILFIYLSIYLSLQQSIDLSLTFRYNKVLVEKGDGRGVGCGLEVVGGSLAKGPVNRARWHPATADNPRREENVYAKVIGKIHYCGMKNSGRILSTYIGQTGQKTSLISHL